MEEAERIFDDYFSNKPNIKKFVDQTHEFVQKYGYVETMQGHRRLLRTALGKDKRAVNEALRQSVNTIIQGSGAYLTNLSVVYIDDYIRENNKQSRIVATVHDSIVLDCHPSEIHEMAKITKFIMENLPIPFLTMEWKGEPLKYPIVADLEIGENYNDLVDYDYEEMITFKSLKGYVKFHKDQSKLGDYSDNGLAPKEQTEQAIAQVQACKPAYQAIV